MTTKTQTKKFETKKESKMNIEIIQRSHDVIVINLDTGQRIGYYDCLGGANRGVLLGEYVQPETREEWLRRVDAL